VTNMGQKIGPILTIIVLLLIALYSAFYTVDQSEQAILVQLGSPAGGTIEPGLHIKIPLIQKIVFFERRLLGYDTTPAEILSADKKNLEVTNYAKWKIVDPLKFYTTVRDMTGAVLRLGDIIDSEVRMELGRHVMSDIISKPRADIMDPVKERSDKWAQNFGIRIVDVRIKRINLPEENRQAVYERMQTERERQAKKYRSEGQGEALKVKAAADRERTIILAEADRNAQVLRGQGDAEAARIYAEAYEQNPGFFDFTRSLEASRKALDDNTTLVISPDYEFLRFMKRSGAELGPD
jgi:modulator of FtsH protease HflC